MRKKLLQEAIFAALKGGKEILDIYGTNDFMIEHKADESPLTIADKRAHLAIVDVLEKLEIPILSEEGEHLSFEERKDWKECWIVDPLDGTKEFIKRNDEFTVNIALVSNNIPVLGVIYVPVYDQLYFGLKDLGAYRVDEVSNKDLNLDSLVNNAISLPIKNNRDKYVVVGSRSHMNEDTKTFISRLENAHGEVEIVSKGSSLKLCMVAEGKADIYPRFAPTMEWDTAAGHAIVSAANGKVYHPDLKTALAYNKEDLLNPYFICEG